MNSQGYMPGFQQPPQQYQHVPSATPPPPQYAQGQATNTAYAGANGDYGKGPTEGVAEMETEYYFAKPGVVEMGDGTPVQHPNK